MTIVNDQVELGEELTAEEAMREAQRDIFDNDVSSLGTSRVVALLSTDSSNDLVASWRKPEPISPWLAATVLAGLACRIPQEETRIAEAIWRVQGSTSIIIGGFKAPKMEHSKAVAYLSEVARLCLEERPIGDRKRQLKLGRAIHTVLDDISMDPGFWTTLS